MSNPIPFLILPLLFHGISFGFNEGSLDESLRQIEKNPSIQRCVDTGITNKYLKEESKDDLKNYCKKSSEKKCDDKILEIKKGDINCKESKLSYKAEKSILRGLASTGNKIGSGVNKLASLVSKDAKAEEITICNQMPEIKSAVIYQSVEAPQIEPVDLNKIKHEDYDLVEGKESALLVRIKLNDKVPIDKKFKFSLSISGKVKNDLDCFTSVKSIEGNVNPLKECSFTKEDAKTKIIEKLIYFPQDEINQINENIPISLYVIHFDPSTHPNQKCSKKTFNIKVHRTRPLTIGFSGLARKHCSTTSQVEYTTEYTAGYDALKHLIRSNEVTMYIPDMFPSSKIRVVDIADPDFVGLETHNKDLLSWIKADCSREGILFGRGGLVQDVRQAIKRRNQIGVEKMIVAYPVGYLNYHNIDGEKITGLVFQKIYKHKFIRKFGSLRASHHIAFVRDDQKDKGTIAHEIGHTLGQFVEFYDTNNDYHYCKKVNYQSKSCDEYNIKRSFKSFRSFNNDSSLSKGILGERYTIMSNKSDIYGRWIDRDTYQKSFIYGRWIDRDTYQKSFKYLAIPDPNQKDEIDFIDKIFTSRQNIVTFDGVYSVDDSKFINTNNTEPKVEGSRYGLPTDKLQGGDILVELKLWNQLISEVTVTSDQQAELIISSKIKKTVTLKYVPIVASLPVSEWYGNEDLEVIVTLKSDKESKVLFKEFVKNWRE